MREDWRWLTVQQLQDEGVLLVEDGNHGEYRPRPSEFVEDGVAKFIRAADMADGRILFDAANTISDVALRRIRKGIGHPGDILFSHKGTVGKLAVAPSDAEPFVCSPQTTFWRVLQPSVLDPGFLYVFMRSPLFVSQWHVRKGETDMADYVSLTAQRQLKIPLPEPAQQRQLAAAMRGLDRSIDNNRRRIELMEEMARLIYREWFVHLRFPGHEHANLSDSDLGPIPDGWHVSPASTAFEVNPRERLRNDAEYRFLAMGDLSETGMVCWPSELKVGTSGAKFRNGDTLFARITPCLENGKTGFVACLDDGEIGRGSTEFVVLRGREVGPEFTYLTAREESFRQNAIKSMTGASGRQRVRNECFDSYLLAVPAIEVERKFRKVVCPMFELVFSLARQNQVLAEARDLLLPRLISGELDTSDLDLDLEPVA